MIPNMKFYVISIVSIFLALAIGIYIGFSLDANEFIEEQRDDLVTKLEEKFDYLKEENQNLKDEVDILELENSQYANFSELIYPEIIKNRLAGLKVAIIETNDEYIYSGIGKTLGMAGADVVSIVTIKDKFLNEELLKEIYSNGEENIEIKGNIIDKGIEDLTNAIISGNNKEIIELYGEYGLINMVGSADEPVDYIVIAGGSEKEDFDRINYLDRKIVEVSKRSETPIIGIEKTKVNFSYISEYKNYRISTVDNVDTVIGKVALIMAMEGRPGYYGVKPSAESLIPNPSDVILE
ncbi:MAG: Copper transport outer membrane protein, MctB [Sporanaerobacter sp.]|uniref:copper transporter n=1 Tax=Sporanaerobacter sp. TaxID=2010183 RepID=UPI003A0FE531